MKDWPQRKRNRLKGYDYSAVGIYFVTICIRDRVSMLWDVGARIARPQNPLYTLTAYGKAVDEAVQEIPERYPMVTVDQYVIMPNHIHLLLAIHHAEDNCIMRTPTVSTIMCQMKGAVTKKIGFSMWQKLFHDHIIRNEEEYLKIWRYIENNPMNWEEDCFYVKIKENDK